MFVITKNTEAKLLEAAFALRNDPYGYYALCFQFSLLQESNRSNYQIKIAINILHDLFKGVDGGVFLCGDQDLFLIVKDCGKPLIEKAIFQLRYLFSEDPLAYKSIDQENEQFCTVYDLEFHANDLIQRCKKKVGGFPTTTQERPEPVVENTPTHHSLTPLLLDKVESELNKIDIQHAIRKQPVCAIVKGKSVRPLFHEMYVHIPHLRRLLSFDVQLTESPALFYHLKTQLDRQVISLICRQPRFYFRDSLSLNLTIPTLLSREFSELNRLIDQDIRSSIVIEISIGDVFSDILGYFTAQRFLKQQGYRLCLDGLNSYSIPQISRESLGFDLVKLQWDADTEAHLKDSDYYQLASIMKKCGTNRVILTRCDSKYAIDYGQKLGISLFQGRHLDKILHPHAKVEN